MVTVSFALKNTGTGPTTNLVATLLAGNGISEPSAPQTYGALAAGGAAISMPFTFQANGACGGTITATLQLSDGSLNLWTVTYTFTLGRFSQPLAEDFDEVRVPALPAGWQTSVSNSGIAWVTSSNISDTASNSAFDAEAASAGLGELVSPPIAISSPTAQLTFQNQFNTDADPMDPSNGYAGGVLEIQIGNGSFTDILSAGGIFTAGGYNRTIDASGNNPLAGRQAWSGTSGGFMPTVVTLPVAAAGQTIRLRWVLGSDSTNSTGNGGWYIDTVSINEGYLCCAMPPVITQQPTNQTVVIGSSVSFPAAATGTPPLSYQWLSGGFVFDSQTNALLQFTNVQAAQMGSYSLEVTNVAGSVTSQLAILRVLVPPSFTDISLSSSNVALSFPSISALSYELEYKDSLTAPQWIALPPALTGDGSVLSLIDTNAPATNRFYRLRCY
jgi:hypothetical protein